MKRLYLFSDQGMPTSFLASRLQVCADKHMLPIEVNAFSYKKMQGIVEEKHPDIILLGPQVKYLFDETKKRFDERTPVMLISQEDYGMMDGEKVLKKALLLLQKRKRGEL